MVLTKETFRFNNLILFLGYTAITLLILYSYSQFIINDEMYYNSLSERLTTERIGEIINVNKKFQWISYALVPAKLILKIFLPAICIFAGAMLVGHEIEFRNIFKICLFAELVFAASAIITFALHLLFINASTFDDLSKADYFSLHALFRSASTPVYMVYPLQVINVFEVIYWLLLAAGLQIFLGKSFGKMFSFVMMTYGIGLLCWIVFVEFMVVTYMS